MVDGDCVNRVNGFGDGVVEVDMSLTRRVAGSSAGALQRDDRFRWLVGCRGFFAWRSRVLPPPTVLMEDRRVFIAALAEGDSALARLVGLVLSEEDIDLKICFMEPITSKGVHAWLMRQEWRISVREG